VRAVGGSGVGICVQSHKSDSYTTVVAHGSGPALLPLADDLGPLTGTGKKTPTICPKGRYQIYAAGADYPAYEASYPKNLSQLPVIRGTSGQADVTTSDTLNGSYP